LTNNLERFNFTEGFEKGSKIILLGLRREALDKEVQSPLGVLVLVGLLLNFLFTILLLECSTAVDLLAIDFLIVHFLDSLICSIKSIFNVLVVGAAIADEAVLTDIVGIQFKRSDVTEWREGLFDLVLCPVCRKVFNKDVVENSSEFSLSSWSILNSNSLFAFLCAI
jgi:hypothetical protein